MRDGEAAKGAGVFPSTRLSALRGLHSPDAAERQRSLDALALAYWRPAYRHLRLRWRRSADDSHDLCQEFFARAIEKRFFEDFDPDKGRFRTFLRTCLDRFVANEDKAGRRLKRGGAAIRVPLDVSALESEIARSAPLSPEQADEHFEREWVRGLLDVSIATLEKQLEERGKRVYFQVFDRYVLSDRDPRPSYAEVAAELGVAVTDVTNWLAFARRELRRIVMDRLRELTASEEELQEEVRIVVGA